ncbi:unnamed protein product [Chironomus riparius]|uniref:Uncharacterized protein n=1 Tax=Chironomus riparius TaxID=315576 RepID=A0A9N9WKX0_9DIPT|nr:unnamed protein product [Chironomus riparius]
MGCGFSNSSATVREANSPDFQSSADTFHRNRTKTKETMIQAFSRIDDEILALENLSPGSRLTTAEAWIDHLQSIKLKIDDTTMTIQSERLNTMEPISEIDETTLDDLSTPSTADRDQGDLIKVKKLAVKLQVAFDIKKASENEEFLARISRSMMEVELQRLKMDMVDHARKRVDTLSDSFNNLRQLYLEQDGLIASVSGGTYNSSLEQELDSELEAVREIRDRLSGVAEQWRTASNLMAAAAKGSLQAYEYWCLIEQSKIAPERIQLALDTRTACFSSLVALDCAQQSLPQVEIPFITLRQCSAVRHSLIYILTDMANENRYKHTKNVLEAYQTNTAKAVEWLFATYKKTLDEDLTTQIDNIKVLAFRLRRERVRHFKEIVGNKMYTRPFIKMPS